VALAVGTDETEGAGVPEALPVGWIGVTAEGVGVLRPEELAEVAGERTALDVWDVGARLERAGDGEVFGLGVAFGVAVCVGTSVTGAWVVAGSTGRTRT